MENTLSFFPFAPAVSLLASTSTALVTPCLVRW